MEETMDLQSRSRLATLSYLNRIGMVVTDVDYPTPDGDIPIVALDGDELIHVYYEAHPAGEQPPTMTDALKAQHRAQMHHFKKTTGIEKEVRYDVVNITVLEEDRALLRHSRGDYDG